MTEIKITADDNGRILEKVLKEKGFSRRLITYLKRSENGMTRNGMLVRTVDRVYENDVIVLDDRKKDNNIIPNGDLKAGIIYEDSDLVVFDKPPFMPVHPSINHQLDTLGNLFSFLYPDKTFRPVNRLDRDTSGCVVVAKNSYSANLLQKSCEKKYLCITEQIDFCGGRICEPIARENESIILRCVRDDGKYSATDWLNIADKNGLSLIECSLETGRTHQIRVHFSYKGYPLIGDKMYGGDCSEMKRQALHCSEVSFVRPSDRKRVRILSELPADMKNILK